MSMLNTQKILLCLCLVLFTGCKSTSSESFTSASSASVPPHIAGKILALSALHLPDDNKVLFFMGQDTETLSAFKKSVLDKDSTFPAPGGVTLYTKISHSFKYGSLAGLKENVDYGSGINNFIDTLNEFPKAALAVGLDMTDAQADCKSIPTKAIAGLIDADVTPELIRFYRSEVDRLITFLKSTDRPIFLRIGYEFDGPWNCYNAAAYKASFRFIKARINALNADKIATVWQTAAWLRNQNSYQVTDNNHLDQFYPGDDVVDWIALSKFYGEHYRKHQWSCDALNPPWFTPIVSAVSQHDRTLDFARLHNKPVIIAEAAPAGYSTSTLTSSCIFTNRTSSITAEELWDKWYQDWFDYIEKNRDIIRAVAYINTHWHAQSMWHCVLNTMAGTEHCKQGYWGDSRIEGNSLILKNFSKEISKPFYVKINNQ
ncbi:MAG: endo-1,3-beta-xylanase [Pseudomonadota bacterium]